MCIESVFTLTKHGIIQNLYLHCSIIYYRVLDGYHSHTSCYMIDFHESSLNDYIGNDRYITYNTQVSVMVAKCVKSQSSYDGKKPFQCPVFIIRHY